MISFENVSKQFGEVAVLNSVSLKINRGETVFLIGRSGVGKSVCLKLVAGLLMPNAGQIYFDGISLAGLDSKQWMDIRRRVSLIFQNPALIDSMSVYENLALGIRAHRLCSNRKEERSIIQENLESVGVDLTVLGRMPQTLSLGDQKRISIARALAVGSEVLMFDEPTTGLDPISTSQIIQLIQKLGKSGRTVWVVSHDMQCALTTADRILLLDECQIAVDTPAKLVRERNHPLLKLFLEEADAREIY